MRDAGHVNYMLYFFNFSPHSSHELQCIFMGFYTIIYVIIELEGKRFVAIPRFYKCKTPISMVCICI